MAGRELQKARLAPKSEMDMADALGHAEGNTGSSVMARMNRRTRGRRNRHVRQRGYT